MKRYAAIVFVKADAVKVAGAGVSLQKKASSEQWRMMSLWIRNYRWMQVAM